MPPGRLLGAPDFVKVPMSELLDVSYIDKRVSDIDPHYPPELWPEHFDELRRTGKMSFETQHRAKSGRILDVEVSVAYFEFNGAEYCCSSVRDITLRKQAENMLRLQHDVLAMVASTTGSVACLRSAITL